MVALPTCLFAQSFPLTPACPEWYIHRSFWRWKSDMWHTYMPVWAFQSTFCFLQQIYWICEGDSMCILTVTSWWNLAEGLCDCFHLHCQAGGWDHTGCTVFVDSGCTLLNSDAPRQLVFDDWAVSVHSLHSEILWKLHLTAVVILPLVSSGLSISTSSMQVQGSLS